MNKSLAFMAFISKLDGVFTFCKMVTIKQRSLNDLSEILENFLIIYETIHASYSSSTFTKTADTILRIFSRSKCSCILFTL